MRLIFGLRWLAIHQLVNCNCNVKFIILLATYTVPSSEINRRFLMAMHGMAGRTPPAYHILAPEVLPPPHIAFKKDCPPSFPLPRSATSRGPGTRLISLLCTLLRHCDQLAKMGGKSSKASSDCGTAAPSGPRRSASNGGNPVVFFDMTADGKVESALPRPSTASHCSRTTSTSHPPCPSTASHTMSQSHTHTHTSTLVALGDLHHPALLLPWEGRWRTLSATSALNPLYETPS